MPLSRRAALALAAGAVGVGLVGAGAWAARSPYAPPRRLPDGALDSPSFEGRLGEFRIRLGASADRPTTAGHPDVARGLEITRGDRTVWACRGGFLVAATGSLDWTEDTGHFTAARNLDQAWTEVTVTETTADPEQVVWRGTLGNDTGQQREWRLAFSTTGDGPGAMRLEADLSVPGVDLVGLRADLADGERVHGLGAQFAPFDLRGEFVPLVTREQGVGRGRQPLTTLAEWTNSAGGDAYSTYAPMPSLVTSRLRGLEWAADQVAEVDLREGMEVAVWSGRLTASWRTADTPRALVRTEHPGLPTWSGTGAILGLQGGSATIRDKLAVLRDAEAATSGVWLQDWVGRRTTDFGDRLWWTWQLDRTRYPDWERLVDELGEDGVRVLTYVNPFLADPRDKPEPVDRDLYAEAVGAGFVVRDRAGRPYLQDQDGFDAVLVDLTHPVAYEWLAEVVAAMPHSGGWMADFAESLPFDAVLHDGDPAEMHNRWPALWHQLNAEVRGDDDLVFHRSAWRGAANPMWAGDQLTTFDRHDGMGSALRGILAGGVSGLPLMHSDVGGYTGLPQPIVGVHRTPELLRRWAEWSAWSPIFRTHEGNRPDEFAQAYDPDLAGAVAAQSRVFAALADYRARVLAEPLPAMRHGWLEAEGAATARDDQYFYGPSFLVAPVLSPDATRREVVLPPGDWVHVWSGDTYPGDRTVEVPAPLGRTPVFHRAGDAAAESSAARVRAAQR